MDDRRGIPFKNIINSKVITVEEQVIKLLYHEQVITIMSTGWGDYHIILENGAVRETRHQVMTEQEVKDNFNIDITQY